MGRRTQDTKKKDTKNGDRAELLCAISWVFASSNDRIVKSSVEDDIKKHIDWYVHRANGRIITYDCKARRFEEYGKGFSPDYYFIAEIMNRQGILGSIYGEQLFMAHEISGYFNFILRKYIVEEVENDVKKYGMKVSNIDSSYRNLYTSPKYDDGHVLTAFPFTEFQIKKLPIPQEFLERQFLYTPEELKRYIIENKLNINF